jgi:hypothetical protein
MLAMLWEAPRVFSAVARRRLLWEAEICLEAIIPLLSPFLASSLIFFSTFLRSASVGAAELLKRS